MSCQAPACPGRRSVADLGVVTAIELMFVLIAGLLSLMFLGYLGRLHAAGIQVQQATQSAARAASMANSSSEGRAAAAATVSTSALVRRCRDTPSVELTWSTSGTGTWQGGSVTVTVTCTVANDALAGLWVPGDRTVRSSDTQPIDRYHR